MTGTSFAGLRRIGAAAIAAAFSLLLLSLPEVGAEEPVEIAAPPPLPVAPMPAGMPAAPAPPTAPQGIVLKSVLGSGAILTAPGANERFVAVGRDVVPGLVLREVGLSHALLGGSGGDFRIEMGRAGAAPVAGAAAPPVMATAATPAQQQRETLEFRLGLQPMTSGGRISGYALKPGANLPHLQRAGLRAGDVIVGVNGSRLDEERLMELSWQIANSSKTEFEFVRNGRKMKAAITPSS